MFKHMEYIMLKKSFLSFYLFIFILGFCRVSFAENTYGIKKSNKSYTVKVILKKHSIKADLFTPEPDLGKPLIIAVHGSTYGKWMWNIPGYSWSDYFTGELGYPLLAVDCLGHGESSQVNGDLLTPSFQAKSLKKILEQVKSEFPQRKIIWAGHSMGALLGNMVAGSSDLIDGLIIMGWLHSKMEKIGPPLSLSSFFNDYITWTDKERTESFYFIEKADPKIIDLDNSLANPMPKGYGFAGLYPDLLYLGRIRNPVFLSVGEHDGLWENKNLSAEASLYRKAEVTNFFHLDSGHVALLHLNNQILLENIKDWLMNNF